MTIAYATTTGTTGAAGGSMLSFVIMMVALFAVMYFLLIRPQKKKEKEATALRNSIEVGDEITTIGGIVGKVVSVKEDDDFFVMETGADKTKIKVRRWAIGTRDKAVDD